MNHKTDLRITRTKKAIRNGFLNLVNEKGFETISIKDIANEAQINRATFYLHYRDKFDLLEKLSTEVLNELTEAIKPDVHVQTMEVKLPYLLQTIESVLINIQNNSDFYKVMFGKHGVYDFHNRMFKVVKGKFKSVFMERGLKEDDFHFPMDLLVHFIASALIGVVIWWLEHDLEQSPKQMAMQVLPIIKNGPLNAAGFKAKE